MSLYCTLVSRKAPVAQRSASTSVRNARQHTTHTFTQITYQRNTQYRHNMSSYMTVWGSILGHPGLPPRRRALCCWRCRWWSVLRNWTVCLVVSDFNYIRMRYMHASTIPHSRPDQTNTLYIPQRGAYQKRDDAVHDWTLLDYFTEIVLW